MGRSYQSRFFKFFLFSFVWVSIFAEHHYARFAINYTRLDDKSVKEYRSSSDFSHDKKWYQHNIFCTNQSLFSNYTAHDFKSHFTTRGYTESEILNQSCLYMSDEFVKHAQTYSGYKNKIREMYVELKNLSVIQKACRVVNGTYCRKLQKRIGDLYRSLDAIKEEPQIKGYYNPINAAEKTFHPTISEHFAEYETLESVYQSHTPNLSKAINARSVIYRNSAANNSWLQPIQKSYNLDDNIKKLLSRYGHKADSFTHCYGNQLQQVIHQESLDILSHVDNLPPHSVLYDHQEALIDMAASIVDYNHADMPDKAMVVADFCWTLLDYGQAIAEGAALGLYSAAHDILTNPIEATVSIVAGKQVLAFQLCKVLYNVADIGATAIHDFKTAQDKWDKYTEPLNTIIDAINKKEIAVRDAIKAGTAFVVGYRAQGKLLGGLGKFCNTIKHKSISFVKNSPLFSPQDYLTTPEGLLFKVAKLNQLEHPNKASYLKESIENRIGTVWDTIKPTDLMYPGTKIPKSFELTLGNQKLWVAPNATKHMTDYAVKHLEVTHSVPMNSQALLTSFKIAVEQAVSKGILYDTMIRVGCWEFRFGMPRKAGLLPSIYHANFKPNGW